MNASPYDHELSAAIGDKPYRLFNRLLYSSFGDVLIRRIH